MKCFRLRALQIWGTAILDCTCIWGKTYMKNAFIISVYMSVWCVCMCMQVCGGQRWFRVFLSHSLLYFWDSISHQLELINSAAPAGQQAQCLLSLLCQHWHCKQVPGFSCQVLEIKIRFSGLCSQHFTDRAIFLASIFWLWLVLWDQVWNFAPGHPCSRRMSSGSRLSNLYHYYVMCQCLLMTHLFIQLWGTKDALDYHNGLQKPALKQQQQQMGRVF